MSSEPVMIEKLVWLISTILSYQSKSLGLVSWCDRESLSAVRLTHERELFGGRVGAGSLGGEPVMRAERVRSVRSSAVAAAEGPFERRSCRSAVRAGRHA